MPHICILKLDLCTYGPLSIPTTHLLILVIVCLWTETRSRWQCPNSHSFLTELLVVAVHIALCLSISQSIELVDNILKKYLIVFFLGGVELKLLDQTWLRTKISMVGQEPTLFAYSIKDNIAYGRGATEQVVRLDN